MVSATDPAGLACASQDAEDVREVHFSGVGFVACRHAGDLDVDAPREVLAECGLGVACGDLDVVEAHLQAEIRSAGRSDDPGGLGLGAQKAKRSIVPGIPESAG